MGTRRGFFGKLFGGLALALTGKALAQTVSVGAWAPDKGWMDFGTGTPAMLHGRETVIALNGEEISRWQARQDHDLLLAAGVSPKELRKAFRGKL